LLLLNLYCLCLAFFVDMIPMSPSSFVVRPVIGMFCIIVGNVFMNIGVKGTKVILIGHSLGGLLARAYMNYLFYKENGIRKDIPIKNMSANNIFRIIIVGDRNLEIELDCDKHKGRRCCVCLLA
jgi:hypothetical protein